MLATQSPYTGLSASFAGPANTVKRDIHEVLSSGQYYVTPEMGGELKAIGSGVDHIKLDNHFLKSSGDFAKRFSPSGIISEKQGKFVKMEWIFIFSFIIFLLYKLDPQIND